MTENSCGAAKSFFSSIQQRGCEHAKEKGLTSELDVIQVLSSEPSDLSRREKGEEPKFFSSIKDPGLTDYQARLWLILVALIETYRVKFYWS